MQNTFSISQIEATLCVWEDILGRLVESNLPRSTTKNKNSYASLDAFRHRNGAITLRSIAITLGVWVDQVYPLIDEGVREGYAFDWEIIPALLDLIEWDANVINPSFIEPAIAAGVVSAQFCGESFDQWSYLQVAGCKIEDNHVTQVPDTEATFFSVYGRSATPNTRALADCQSRQIAEAVATKLAAIYPLNFSSVN